MPRQHVWINLDNQVPMKQDHVVGVSLNFKTVYYRSEEAEGAQGLLRR